jgi:hypothetical protein
MSYQTLYSMPCRLPCQRYMNVDSMFEASIQMIPVGPPPQPRANPQNPPPAKQSGSKEGFDGGEYEPTVSREGYDYDPTISGESFTENAEVDGEAKCNCGPLNRAYRMESCGYNQSPTWDAQRMFRPPAVPSGSNVINEGYEPESNGGTESQCGCGPKNRPYRIESCGYNQSPTWTDQATFRDVYQDRPF